VSKPRLPWVRMVCYFPFAIFNIVAGLVMFAFGFAVPFIWIIGVPLVILAGWPYAVWLRDHATAMVAWEDRDKPLINRDEVIPEWEQEDSNTQRASLQLSEDDMINIILNGNGRGSV
jgi:hypothetical protein